MRTRPFHYARQWLLTYGWLSIHSISGVNFVATEFQRTKTPSVASMSLGGGVSNALDSAIVRVSPTTCITPFTRPKTPCLSFSSSTPASLLSSLLETITRTLSIALPLASRKPLPLAPPPSPTRRLPSRTLVQASTSGLLASTSSLLLTTDRLRASPELPWPPHMLPASSLTSLVSIAP